MGRPSKEYQAFRDLTDRLLSVSKTEVDKRIAALRQVCYVPLTRTRN